MSISKQAMTFRQQRASELVHISDAIRRVIGGNINTTPIAQAITQLKDSNFVPTLKDGSRNFNHWGYSIDDFQIPVETDKHVRPKDVNKLELTLNMKVIADYNNWLTMNDPFIELSFSVSIRGIGNNVYYTGFHIDKHDENLTQKSKEPHPVYHLQYCVNPYDQVDFNYGSVLHLDTPRIVHYPVDFILGIGFLTSNFFPVAFDCLLEDGTFANLYKEYQNRLWKPHSHSIADHWPFEKALITWKPTSKLCPYLQ